MVIRGHVDRSTMTNISQTKYIRYKYSEDQYYFYHRRPNIILSAQLVKVQGLYITHLTL